MFDSPIQIRIFRNSGTSWEHGILHRIFDNDRLPGVVYGPDPFLRSGISPGYYGSPFSGERITMEVPETMPRQKNPKRILRGGYTGIIRT